MKKEIDVQPKTDNANIVTDLTIEYSELLLDSQLKDGILKEIPVLRTALGIFNIGKNLRDFCCMKKIIDFFNSYKSLSEEEKESILFKFSKLDGERLCESIFFILDKAEHSKKASLLGKALKILKDRDINFYFRLCYLINNAFYEDLLYLCKFKDEKHQLCSSNKCIPEEVMESLFSAGFLVDCGFDGGSIDGKADQGTIYCLNDYGVTLKQLLS